MADEKTIIDGLLTVEKAGDTLISNRPALLIINDPDEKYWTHNWHIKDVQLPIRFEEVEGIFNKGIEDPEARFKIFLAERGRMRSFEGEAFISGIAYTGVLVTLQGASSLTISG